MNLFKAQASMGSTFTVSSSRDYSPGVEIGLVPGSLLQHNGALVLAGALKSKSAIDHAVSQLKADLDDAATAAKVILDASK